MRRHVLRISRRVKQLIDECLALLWIFVCQKGTYIAHARNHAVQIEVYSAHEFAIGRLRSRLDLVGRPHLPDEFIAPSRHFIAIEIWRLRPRGSIGRRRIFGNRKSVPNNADGNAQEPELYSFEPHRRQTRREKGFWLPQRSPRVIRMEESSRAFIVPLFGGSTQQSWPEEFADFSAVIALKV